MTNRATRDRRRRRAMLLLAVVLLSVWLASPAGAGPMPPQLPSAEEMARLAAQMSASLAKVKAAQAQLDAVVRDYEVATDRLTDLIGHISAAQQREAALQAELVAADAALNQRAANIYKAERIGMINALL